MLTMQLSETLREFVLRGKHSDAVALERKLAAMLKDRQYTDRLVEQTVTQ
jgi:hypothetical protein